MELTITAKTSAECRDFFKLCFEDVDYYIEDFAKKFKTVDFSLDEKLKKCSIIYRGKSMSYEEMRKANGEFGKELKFVNRFSEELRHLEYYLVSKNNDYYKASKYIDKTEKCIQTARYYSLRSYRLILTDYEINWSSGYNAQFLCRTLDFSTAIVWYNSCFDYILQIAYFAFGFYKKVPEYSPQITHENLLKKCDYISMSLIYGQNKSEANFKKMWKIISNCQNRICTVNSWANYIKHKGGISFDGLYPQNPLYISKTDLTGNIISESSDFESIKIDLDNSYNIMKDTHVALYECINELIDLIDFNSVKP